MPRTSNFDPRLRWASIVVVFFASSLAVSSTPISADIGETSSDRPRASDAASLRFRIVAEQQRSRLPVTGPDLDLVVTWALALLVAGVQIAAMRRRGLWRV